MFKYHKEKHNRLHANCARNYFAVLPLWETSYAICTLLSSRQNAKQIKTTRKCDTIALTDFASNVTLTFETASI